MSKKGDILMYHVKNQALKTKKPAGCPHPTKGQTLKYPGRNIKVRDCDPKRKNPKKKTKKTKKSKKK